jgi:hypothetical protein
MDNIIKFPKEHLDNLKKERMKKMINLLIDLSDGDFALIFKTKDMTRVFEGDFKEEFVICMSDISQISWKKDNYFFKGFNDVLSPNSNRRFFDLNQE